LGRVVQGCGHLEECLVPLGADLIRRPRGVGGGVPVDRVAAGLFLAVGDGRRGAGRRGRESAIGRGPIDAKIRQT
jgi:hypothetical protein